MHRALWVLAASATPSPAAGQPARSTGAGVLAIVIFVVLVVAILMYRQRVLRPFMERYERPHRDEPPEDRPTS